MATEACIPFKDYIEFYKENEKKIFMTETYPINTDNMDRWKKAVKNAKRENCDVLIKRGRENPDNAAFQKYSPKDTRPCDTRDNTAIYELFAETFENVIRHISFDDMLKKIGKICEEISKLVKDGNYDDIYIYVNDISEKSNTWVSLLFTSFLADNTILKDTGKVINNISLVYDLYKQCPKKKILVLHIDDMAYTGTQMETGFGVGVDNLLEKKDENNNLHYYLGVPFIGSSAVELFKKEGHTNIKYFENTEVIKKFIKRAEEYVTNNYSSSSIGKEFLKALSAICNNQYWATTKGYGTSFAAFECHNAKIAIYFDHKVADALSTFDKILYVGSVPTTDEKEYENIPLIKGCEKKKKTKIAL